MGIARNDKRVIFPVSISGYCHVENVNMAINLIGHMEKQEYPVSIPLAFPAFP